MIFNTNSQSTSSSSNATLLPIHFTPGPHDVICAREKDAMNHEGNKKYKQIIQSQLKRYASSCNKYEKSLIVSEVINAVCTNCGPQGGGFIKQQDDGRWYQVDVIYAREKVGQGFRDKLHGMYKSSTRRKRRRREHVSVGVVHDIENLIQTHHNVSTCLGKLSNEMEQRGVGAPDLFMSRMFNQANMDMLEAFKKDKLFVSKFQQAEQQQKRSNNQ